jgi:hypothetical protein
LGGIPRVIFFFPKTRCKCASLERNQYPKRGRAKGLYPFLWYIVCTLGVGKFDKFVVFAYDPTDFDLDNAQEMLSSAEMHRIWSKKG